MVQASGTFANGMLTPQATTSGSGVATATAFTANATARGPYNVAVAASGLPTVNFALTNTDTSATVTSMSSTLANGTYGTGQAIPITVTFSKAVYVTGTPTLALSKGGTASYSSGSGTTTLTFSYTIVAGRTTSGGNLDASSASALTGTIKNLSSTPATLKLPVGASSGPLASNKAIVIEHRGAGGVVLVGGVGPCRDVLGDRQHAHSSALADQRGQGGLLEDHHCQ